MANSTHPEREITDNCGFLSNTGQELDIVEHWVNLTIEDVVSQGCKLREEKSRSCVPHPVCRLANAKNKRLPFSEDLCSFPRAKSKLRCQTYESGAQPYCSPSRSPSIKGKICVPSCPLRIAELAVPTKRQCIETWRNKCNVLPPFMVERLKAQVMDERPIAHVADAVSCFKRGKPSKGKSSKLTNRHMKSDRSSRMRDERMSELRRLCSIFGKKIAQKLITPQNLILNPELSKISKIVADEVASMMKSDNFKSEDLNEQMRAEISEKIAVWISTVMEDMSYKLLEEDLRAKKRTDMHNREEQLITLVKLVSRSERTSELEEEEGPVLDFLDDVFDNVVNICISPEVDVPGDYSEKTSQASGENRDMSNADFFDTSTPYVKGDNITIDQSNIKLSIADIQNVIYNVIDFVVNDNTEESEPTNDLVDKEELSNLVPIEVIRSNEEIRNKVNEQLDEPLYFDTKEIPDNSEPETIDVSKVMPVEDFIVASENLGLNNNPIDDSEASKPDINTSDLFGILAEESNDDKDKKVQFSDIDLGNRGRLDKNGIPLPGNDDTNTLETPSTNTESRQKVFQPPNENLLSDVDERWPKDVPSHAIKATTSVSRSVTSLGNIIEKEEKLSALIAENQLDPVLNKEDIKNIDKIIAKEKEEKSVTELLTEITPGINNKKDTYEEAASQALRTDGEQSKEEDNLSGIEKTDPLTDTSAFEHPTDHANRLQKGEHTLGFERQNGIEDHSVAKYSKDLENILQKDENTLGTDRQKGIEGHKRTVGEEQDKEGIYQAGQEQVKTPHGRPEQKFDYKVDPSTAPLWLRDDHGKGEPSVFSIVGGCRSKGKLEEHDIRLWCKDLEHMFSNVDLWNSWLETTCIHILCLKRKRRAYSEKDGYDLRRKIYRKMVILKKDIDKDAILWTKLYERANKSLNTYKTRMTSTEYSMLCNCKNLMKRKL